MAHKQVIEVDLDGVLRNIAGKCCQIYRRDFDLKSTICHDDIVDWDIDQFFPKLPQAHKVFFGEYAEEVFLDSDPYEIELAEELALIKEEGELIIATDQMSGNGKYALEWLENQRVPYDGIFISPHKTLLKGNIALEDKLTNLKAYQDVGIIAVCYDQPYNRGRWDGPRVKSLHEFYLFLQDLKQK